MPNNHKLKKRKVRDICVARTTTYLFFEELGELIFVDAVIEFGKNDTMLDKVLKIHDKQNPDACYVSESFIKSA